MSEYAKTNADIAATVAEVFGDVAKKDWPDQHFTLPDGTEITRPARQQYATGDPNLPIAAHREQIVDLVEDNQVVVLESPTGTGKSTQVAQWLMETGNYDKVYETQPRVVAARSVAEWVRVTLEPMIGEKLAEELVGWQTAPDSNMSTENLIDVITDGIQIQREIHGNGLGKHEVLLIDECHEKSENMQILMLIAKRLGLHVVIMSATMNASEIAEYYVDEEGEPAPIVSIEARTFPIEERDYRKLVPSRKKQRGAKDADATIEPEYTIEYRREVDAIMDHAGQGRDILLFVPKKNIIDRLIGQLRHRLPNGYTIVGLHGEQTPEEQRLALIDYPGHKVIISTSVGQTSLTPNVDVVLDSGFDRTSYLKDGVDGLDLCDASVASRDQRRGRCGRTKPGYYELVQLDGFPVPKSNDEVADFGNSETRRKRPDDLLMKLGRLGIDAGDLYEPPKSNETQLAYRRLVRLGAIALEDYERSQKDFSITPIGEAMLDVPLGTQFARMYVESYQYSSAVQMQMAAALAVQQAGGIHSRQADKTRWQHISHENNSDLLHGLDLFIEAMRVTEQERKDYCIVEQKFRRAKAAYGRLVERLDGDLDPLDLTAPTDIERAQLQACMVAGIDELYHYKNTGTYTDAKGHVVKAAKDSQVQPMPGVLVAGTPYNLVEMRMHGRFTNRLVRDTFTVSAEMLVQHAPDRITKELVGHTLTEDGEVERVYDLYFDDNKLNKRIREKADSSSAEVRDFLIDEIFDGALVGTIVNEGTGVDIDSIANLRNMVDELRGLQHRTAQMLGIEDAVAHMKQIILENTPDDANTLQAIAPYIAHKYVQQQLPEAVTNEMRRSIHEAAPDTIALYDERANEYVEIPVVYDKNVAYITVAKRYYPLLGATIPELGDRVVRVRPEGGSRYADLDVARTQHQSRGASRGNTVAPEEKRRRRDERESLSKSQAAPQQRSIAELRKATTHWHPTTRGGKHS